ncbi:MAG TPA: hypothetical protein VK661_07140 [Planctomycetota bacterium]|nr:hypothetical protein [Planctomycetota bacterium]
MRTSLRSFVILAAGLALLAGCSGATGGGGGLGVIPVAPVSSGPSQVLLVQQASNAGHAVDQATQIANDVIIGNSTGSSTSTAPGGASVFQYPAYSFSFSSSFSLTIDLDGQNAAGNDRFPNATGVIDLTAEGSISGTLASGEATYSVVVTASTDLVFTNPETGATATIPQGSFWSWMLTIDWTRTDSNNWSVVSTAVVAVSVDNMILDDGSTTFTVDVDGSRTVVCTLERVDGVLSNSRTIEGTLTVVIDDGVTVNTIVIEIQGFNQFMVTINGEEFGPLTAAEVRALFDAQFD